MKCGICGAEVGEDYFVVNGVEVCDDCVLRDDVDYKEEKMSNDSFSGSAEQ